MCVSVTELCGKDGVCESDVCVCEGSSSVDFLFCASTQMLSSRHTALLRSATQCHKFTTTRKTKVHITECHTCHAKCRGVIRD